MAQVESIISPEALPIFGQFFTTAEFLMECGNEYFIVPAPTDNMAEKTLVKTHRASFPPRTLFGNGGEENKLGGTDNETDTDSSNASNMDVANLRL
ncbi:MAG: hypothetical protein COZ94_11075, partial [Nitrospirae bacterium CG_4_8_14_3_um_filter_41_47]